jgi:hypothetical protein
MRSKADIGINTAACTECAIELWSGGRMVIRLDAKMK